MKRSSLTFASGIQTRSIPVSASNLGYSNARNKGEAVCVNPGMIKRELVEERVLKALSTRLMSPDGYAAFVRGFTAEWNSEQKDRAVAHESPRDALKRLARKI